VKKRYNTTEKIGFFIVIMACGWIQQNYILAFLEKPQINESVTLAVIATIIGAFLTLCIKSLGEKMSANRHKINAKTGVPHDEKIREMINGLGE
jgi:hypothetical protein